MSIVSMLEEDKDRIVERLPDDLLEIVEAKGLFIAGGFCRAVIAGEEPSNIDVYGKTADGLFNAAESLRVKRTAREEDNPCYAPRLVNTQRAVILSSPPRLRTQFIRRATFRNHLELLASMDFTVCMAAVYMDAGDWFGCVDDRFYQDLAARRLRYAMPTHNADNMSALLRVTKYARMGYAIKREDHMRIVARAVRDAVGFGREISEDRLAGVLAQQAASVGHVEYREGELRAR